MFISCVSVCEFTKKFVGKFNRKFPISTEGLADPSRAKQRQRWVRENKAFIRKITSGTIDSLL